MTTPAGRESGEAESIAVHSVLHASARTDTFSPSHVSRDLPFPD